jgi:hypothetical protein
MIFDFVVFLNRGVKSFYYASEDIGTGGSFERIANGEPLLVRVVIQSHDDLRGVFVLHAI